jgi:hypothetical protein
MNYAVFYRENAGKDVIATMTDGEVFSGELFAYISAQDNDPDPESIVVGRTELFTCEIERLEVVP